MSLSPSKLNKYYTEARELAIRLGDKGFPLDKLYNFYGTEKSNKFKFASGIVDLKEIEAILEMNNEETIEVRYKRENKEGVVKQRESLITYSRIVALNYEIRLAKPKIYKKVLWEYPPIVERYPEIPYRRMFLKRFVETRCEGVVHFNEYQFIKQCAIELGSKCQFWS